MTISGGWENDDIDGFDDEEGSELSDDSPPSPSISSSPPIQSAPPTSRVRSIAPNGHAKASNGTPRAVKVKPMSAGMRQKWPDVVSCLLTLGNGRQVIFVR